MVYVRASSVSRRVKTLVTGHWSSPTEAEAQLPLHADAGCAEISDVSVSGSFVGLRRVILEPKLPITARRIL